MPDFVPNQEGIYFDLPEKAYRDAPGVSQTTVKDFGNAPTPHHFITAKPKPQTKYMKLGTVGHVAVLESCRIKDAYHLRPETYPAKVKGKTVNKDWHNGADWCADWMAKHSDKPVLTADEEAKLPKIVESLSRLEEFSAALENSQREVSFFKRDEETGLLLKCRCDVMATDSDGATWIFDPKKTQRGGGTHYEFSKSAYDYGYHIQCASYLWITGASRFIFVPFDDDEPFASCQFEPDAEMREIGWQDYRRLLLAYAQCVKTNHWPSYPTGIQKLSLPRYAVKRFEQ